MSDFFIYLEDQGIIESTTWAFENLSDEQLGELAEKYMDAYLHEVRVVRAAVAAARLAAARDAITDDSITWEG